MAILRNLLLFILVALMPLSMQAQQVGEQNMQLMNSYILNHRASKMGPITYLAKFGIAEQQNLDIIERFKIYEIKNITVEEHDNVFVVSFKCDPNDACVNQMKGTELGKYIDGLNYFFTSASIANSFAQKAREIIEKDFKKEVGVRYLETDQMQSAPGAVVKEGSATKAEVKTPKEEPIKDILSLDNYNKKAGAAKEMDLSPFGKKVAQLIKGFNVDKLEQAKGAAMENVYASKVKIVKAKQNYIGNYKKQNCFIAEYGTTRFVEDLEDTYYEILDELDENLSQDWESIDHSEDEIYAESKEDIFHTEYINNIKKEMPSIHVMIVPDGKRYTLFMRIGTK